MKSKHNLVISLVLILGVAGSITTSSSAAPKTKPDPNNGAKVMEKQGCLHCHYLRGKGGLIGPPFEGIGKYRSEEEIVDVLTKKRPLPPYYPKGVFDPREFMRHVVIDKKSATEIARYLLSVPVEEALELKGHGEDNPDELAKNFKFTPVEPSENSRRGAQVYKEAGCAACHSIAGSGGWRGPSLDGVGARLSRIAMENRIKRGATIVFAGKEYKPTEYSMPPQELSDEQVKRLTDFLMTLPQQEKTR